MLIQIFLDIADFVQINLDVFSNIQINNVLTLPAMGFNYLRSKGCYNGCQSLSGLPREIINICCRGGRTMSANNLKFKIEDKIINDFDAVSLYPSAMARIEGFIKEFRKY